MPMRDENVIWMTHDRVNKSVSKILVLYCQYDVYLFCLYCLSFLFLANYVLPRANTPGVFGKWLALKI